ncbi:hypothetical protein, partial [Ramlibacter sp.]|uniref:hypothetical protein n=1 Tax=Ramlibacter sp. TaxID=1917967 RepID=UPI002C01B8D1
MIAVGALLALVALNLDTSVSTGFGRVHNIGLQSQQQMLLILGCVMFLAGVILFAVEKIKQTPEEDARDRAAEEAVQAKVKGAITEWKRRGDERVELLESRRIVSGWLSPLDESYAFGRVSRSRGRVYLIPESAGRARCHRSSRRSSLLA